MKMREGWGCGGGEGGVARCLREGEQDTRKNKDKIYCLHIIEKW